MVINKTEGSKKISLQVQVGVGVLSFYGQGGSAVGVTRIPLPNRLRHWTVIAWR